MSERTPDRTVQSDAGESSAAEQSREEELVERVVASFEATPDARLKEIMEAAVRHLHAFLRDVRVTEDEWKQGIDFLTAVEQIRGIRHARNLTTTPTRARGGGRRSSRSSARSRAAP